jgi:hypothetical protein
MGKDTMMKRRIGPERGACGGDPRVMVLEQHRTLRHFLLGAIQIAQAVLSEDEVALALLSYTLLGLRTALERHIAFEEAIILPIVAVELALGPERTALWRKEQARQMEQLTAVVQGGEQRAAVLAESLCRLAEDLLRAMDDEDRTLLSTAYFRQHRPVVH